MVWLFLSPLKRLLHLGRRVVVGVAGLVGVDHAGADRREVDHAGAQGADRCSMPSIVNVTARPEVAVAVAV